MRTLFLATRGRAKTFHTDRPLLPFSLSLSLSLSLFFSPSPSRVSFPLASPSSNVGIKQFCLVSDDAARHKYIVTTYYADIISDVCSWSFFHRCNESANPCRTNRRQSDATSGAFSDSIMIACVREEKRRNWILQIDAASWSELMS